MCACRSPIYLFEKTVQHHQSKVLQYLFHHQYLRHVADKLKLSACRCVLMMYRIYIVSQ